MSNIDEALKYLTSAQVEKDSNGKIKPLTKKQAAGLIGGFIVETGSADLSQLDVIEDGNNNAGRGISQYSHARRGPYDKARQAAIDAGVDPNSLKFQLKYMAEEYGGKHDKDGKSLSGWTKSFENIPDDVEGAARHFTTKYFRPSKPHLDRRIKAAKGIRLDGQSKPTYKAQSAGRSLSHEQTQQLSQQLGDRLKELKVDPPKTEEQVLNAVFTNVEKHRQKQQEHKHRVANFNQQLKQFFNPFGSLLSK